MRLCYLSLTNAQEIVIDRLHRSQLSSNCKQDNISLLLELWGGYKSLQGGWRWGWLGGRAWGTGGAIFNLEIITSGLPTLQALSDCFPNHCTMRVFDLHDEQMISFSWNRSSKTLQHELWRDAVDLAVWAAMSPTVCHTPAWAGNHMGAGTGQAGSSLWVMIYHLPYI